MSLNVGPVVDWPMANPATGDWFFGRTKLLDLTGNPPFPSLTIMGRRRIGKTSLLFRCIHNRAPDTVAYYLDCRGGMSAHRFEAGSLVSSRTVPVMALFSELDQDLRTGKVLLCMDELSAIPDAVANSVWDTSKVLQEVNERRAQNLQVLIADHANLWDYMGTKGSRLLNWTNNEYLVGLDEEESNQYIKKWEDYQRRNGKTLRKGWEQSAYLASAGHPFILQWLCIQQLSLPLLLRGQEPDETTDGFVTRQFGSMPACLPPGDQGRKVVAVLTNALCIPATRGTPVGFREISSEVVGPDYGYFAKLGATKELPTIAETGRFTNEIDQFKLNDMVDNLENLGLIHICNGEIHIADVVLFLSLTGLFSGATVTNRPHGATLIGIAGQWNWDQEKGTCSLFVQFQWNTLPKKSVSVSVNANTQVAMLLVRLANLDFSGEYERLAWIFFAEYMIMSKDDRLNLEDGVTMDKYKYNSFKACERNHSNDVDYKTVVGWNRRGSMMLYTGIRMLLITSGDDDNVNVVKETYQEFPTRYLEFTKWWDALYKDNKPVDYAEIKYVDEDVRIFAKGHRSPPLKILTEMGAGLWAKAERLADNTVGFAFKRVESEDTKASPYKNTTTIPKNDSKVSTKIPPLAGLLKALFE